jgi:hypothetical protein
MIEQRLAVGPVTEDRNRELAAVVVAAFAALGVKTAREEEGAEGGRNDDPSFQGLSPFRSDASTSCAPCVFGTSGAQDIAPVRDNFVTKAILLQNVSVASECHPPASGKPFDPAPL